MCISFLQIENFYVSWRSSYQTAKSQWHWDRVAQIIVQQVDFPTLKLTNKFKAEFSSFGYMTHSTTITRSHVVIDAIFY